MRSSVSRTTVFAIGAIVLVACGGPRTSRPAPRNAPPSRSPAAALLNPSDLYHRAGLIYEGAPVALTGVLRFFASASPDTTLVLLALSMPNRTLTFSGSGDQTQAVYAVVTELRQGGAPVQRHEVRQTVRVASFRETSRSDESVIFQQFFRVPPGSYEAVIGVRDEGSARRTQVTRPVAVPRFVAGTTAQPVLVHQAAPRASADSMPDVIAQPKSTLVFGRDTAVAVYVESYGASGVLSPLVLSVRDSRDQMLWRDTLGPAPAGTLGMLVNVPVTRFGAGQFSLSAAALDGVDTARIPLFLTFAEDWGVVSFEEMLSYLRYFAPPGRLDALRNAPIEDRAKTWAAFWKETDSIPDTPENEALREYLGRVLFANERFRDEGGPGWLTDRGRVYITVGEPENIIEQFGDFAFGQRGRVQVWQYTRYRSQLVFVDQTGFGRWRLTTASESELQLLAGRVRGR